MPPPQPALPKGRSAASPCGIPFRAHSMPQASTSKTPRFAARAPPPWSPRSATGRWTKPPSVPWWSARSPPGSTAWCPWAPRVRVPTVSHAEHDRIVELCVEVAAGRVPVVAGAGSNSTAEAIQRVKHAQAAGADGALVVAPYYNRPSQEGMYRHYAAIAQACDLPVLLYNVPGRTGCDIANETVARLAQLPSIVGIKDATGDLTREGLMRLECPEGFALISGDDGSALGHIAQGGHGVISVTSNVAPGPMATMIRAAREGRFGEALALNDTLARMHKALFLAQFRPPRPSSSSPAWAFAWRRCACR